MSDRTTPPKTEREIPLNGVHTNRPLLLSRGSLDRIVYAPRAIPGTQTNTVGALSAATTTQVLPPVITSPREQMSAASGRRRSCSSFQITSVVGRLNEDDSADDLDESHADDGESSRVTDNDTPSFSEEFSNDTFYSIPSTTSICSAPPVIPTSSQFGLAIVPTTVGLIGGSPGGLGPSDKMPQTSETRETQPVRHDRFKVVKIESTEPFRRGRWVCMDYLDHSMTHHQLGGATGGDDPQRQVMKVTPRPPTCQAPVAPSQQATQAAATQPQQPQPRYSSPIPQPGQTYPIHTQAQAQTYTNPSPQTLPQSTAAQVYSSAGAVPAQTYTDSPPHPGQQSFQSLSTTAPSTSNNPSDIAVQQNYPGGGASAPAETPQTTGAAAVQTQPLRVQPSVHTYSSAASAPPAQQTYQTPVSHPVGTAQATAAQPVYQTVPQQPMATAPQQAQQTYPTAPAQPVHTVQSSVPQSYSVQSQPSQTYITAPVQQTQYPQYQSQLQTQTTSPSPITSPRVPTQTSQPSTVLPSPTMPPRPRPVLQPISETAPLSFQPSAPHYVTDSFSPHSVYSTSDSSPLSTPRTAPVSQPLPQTQIVTQTQPQAYVITVPPSPSATTQQPNYPAPQYQQPTTTQYTVGSVSISTAQTTQHYVQSQHFSQTEVPVSAPPMMQYQSQASAVKPPTVQYTQVQAPSTTQNQQYVQQSTPVSVQAAAPQFIQTFPPSSAVETPPQYVQCHVTAATVQALPQYVQSQLQVAQEMMQVTAVPVSTMPSLYIVNIAGQQSSTPQVQDMTTMTPEPSICGSPEKNEVLSPIEVKIPDNLAAEAAASADGQERAVLNSGDHYLSMMLAPIMFGTAPTHAAHPSVGSTSASGPTVAIDNKIEQAMDLVKSHLMFAVREEVEVLKEKIAELMDRINQLEIENSILRSAATPETLALVAISATAQQSQAQGGSSSPPPKGSQGGSPNPLH